MSYPISNGTISNTDVDTSEDVLELFVNERAVMWCSFVVGTANLSAFTVEFRVSSAASYFTVASAAGDYTTPEGPILGASGDLTTAASGATVHWLKLNVEGVESVRIKAAGTSSTITGHYQIS